MDKRYTSLHYWNKAKRLFVKNTYNKDTICGMVTFFLSTPLSIAAMQLATSPPSPTKRPGQQGEIAGSQAL